MSWGWLTSAIMKHCLFSHLTKWITDLCTVSFDIKWVIGVVYMVFKWIVVCERNKVCSAYEPWWTKPNSAPLQSKKIKAAQMPISWLLAPSNGSQHPKMLILCWSTALDLLPPRRFLSNSIPLVCETLCDFALKNLSNAKYFRQSGCFLSSIQTHRTQTTVYALSIFDVWNCLFKVSVSPKCKGTHFLICH